MKYFFYLLYFGCYYIEWKKNRGVHKMLNPIGRLFLITISNIPKIKKSLAAKGLTPQKYSEKVLSMNDNMSDSNISHIFEWHIGLYLFLFYLFVMIDLLLVLRHLFGNLWLGIYVGRGDYDVLIGMIIIILANVFMFVTCGSLGTDKNEKKFRRQSKKEQRKALWVYLGSFSFVLILFFLLWGHKILDYNQENITFA